MPKKGIVKKLIAKKATQATKKSPAKQKSEDKKGEVYYLYI